MKVILGGAFLLFAHLCLSTLGSNQGASVDYQEGDEDDGELVDPYDFSYDQNSQTNRPTADWNNKNLSIAECARCRYDLKNLNADDDSQLIETQYEEKPCPSSDFLILHFTRSLLEIMESSQSQEVMISLSSRQKDKLTNYLKQTGSAGEIVDMLVYSLDQLPVSGEAINGMYINYGITRNKVIIGILLLVVSCSIFIMVLNCHFSHYRVICAMLFTVFLMSCFLSYMYLYEKEISRRMADEVQRKAYNEACPSPQNATLLTYIRSFVTTEDRACQKLFEDNQIDIFLKVLPIDVLNIVKDVQLTLFPCCY